MKRRFWRTVGAVLYWHVRGVWWETGIAGFVAYAVVLGNLGYWVVAVVDRWPGRGLYESENMAFLSPMMLLVALPLVVVLSYDFIRLWYGVWRGEN